MNLLVDEKIDHTLAFFAKLLCSGVFVVGRDPEEFLANDLRTHVRPEGMPIAWDEIGVAIDYTDRKVSLAARGLERTAVFNDWQGCSIVPRGERGVHFTPVPAEPDLPDAAATPWPMGDLLPDEPLPPEVDEERLRAALDLALDDSRQP